MTNYDGLHPAAQVHKCDAITRIYKRFPCAGDAGARTWKPFPGAGDSSACPLKSHFYISDGSGALTNIFSPLRTTSSGCQNFPPPLHLSLCCTSATCILSSAAATPLPPFGPPSEHALEPPLLHMCPLLAAPSSLLSYAFVHRLHAPLCLHRRC
jgi:hypothetical protein